MQAAAALRVTDTLIIEKALKMIVVNTESRTILMYSSQ
jgi:hypothetical protein